jgi:predicted RecB family nuclease
MTKRLSASRLNNFLGCSHYAALWLDGIKPPEEDNASLKLLRDKGFEHEAVVLTALESERGPAASISTSVPLENRVSETEDAMAKGAPLIYQGAFANHFWVGFPDFLIRTVQANGVWLYEPEDAKLARKAKPAHLLQLGVYAALLKDATSSPIAEGAIHVGLGAPERFDLKRTHSITKRLMRKFEYFAALDERKTQPVRVAACDQCPFHPRCGAEWRAADSPVYVAGIRGDQIIKLETAGIKTLTDLAALSPSSPVTGISKDSVSKLVHQARLQKKGEEQGEGLVEILDVEAGRGFALLPRPQDGDLFFDMEGDPLYPEGLEYLFGLWGPLGADGGDVFCPIWADDRAGEKLAFEELMRLFNSHLDRHPNAYIYHYARYETTALKRLAMRHATMEVELDHLLRSKRFIDLYQVARQAIRTSSESYSLKDLEKIYWGNRTGDVTNAGDSIVEYERWRETGEQAILDSIAHYNKDDCVSTARMRDWLESLRPVEAVYGLLSKEPEQDAEAIARAEIRDANDAERQLLAIAVRASPILSVSVRDLAAELLWFHQRSQKPQWWALFDRQTWSDGDLADDLNSLGGLTLDSNSPVYPDKQSLVATYRFEPQETKLKNGDRCKIALTLEYAGSIVDLDTDVGKVTVRRAAKSGNWPKNCSLIPSKLISQKVLIDAVTAFAKRVVAGDTANDKALISLIERDLPQIKGRLTGEPVVPAGVGLLRAVEDAVVQLDNSYLVIQGPPGTGKTVTTSHVILSLLKAGKRIAVSSNSHKAINNLLTAVEARSIEDGFSFSGAKRATKGNEDTFFSGQFIDSVFKKEGVLSRHQLVGATAYHFSLPEELCGYDYLFIDEAGQVSLGNLVAMASCARNIVLVGDQMQLSQPVQGVHPGESGQSCLDYLMQERATVPPERGILLDISWRMHPAVCRFISSVFYDDRLTLHSEAAERRLVLQDGAHVMLRPAGLSVMEIDHKGCTQSSVEEAMAIEEIIQSLLTQSLRDATSMVRKFTLSDVIVVAPFNAQVNLLRRRLPDGTRVGTVDKFQGQEAAVAIISMAASSAADAPRGSEFLFNINRLNVAISRAQCLAILVRGKNLLEMSPGSIADLQRLEGFARADEAQGLGLK